MHCCTYTYYYDVKVTVTLLLSSSKQYNFSEITHWPVRREKNTDFKQIHTRRVSEILSLIFRTINNCLFERHIQHDLQTISFCVRKWYMRIFVYICYSVSFETINRQKFEEKKPRTISLPNRLEITLSASLIINCNQAFFFSLVAAFRFAIEIVEISNFSAKKRKQQQQLNLFEQEKKTAHQPLNPTSPLFLNACQSTHTQNIWHKNGICPMLQHLQKPVYVYVSWKLCAIRCTTIGYFDSCLCNFYCLMWKTHTHTHIYTYTSANWFIVQSVFDYIHFTAISSHILHARH